MSLRPLHNPVIFLISDADSTTVAQIKSLIDYDNIHVFNELSVVAAQFAQKKPDILIFAFTELTRAEVFYFDIFKSTPAIHAIAHHAIVLCDEKEAPRAFTLCSRGFFDDYAICWPHIIDPHRLSMIMQYLLHDLDMKARHDPVVISKLTRTVRKMGDIDESILQQQQNASQHIEHIRAGVSAAESSIKKVIDDISGNATAFDTNAPGSSAATDLVKARARLESIESSIKPLSQVTDAVGSILKPHYETIKSIKSISGKLKKNILVVDDDEFQLKIANDLLSRHSGYHIECAKYWRRVLNILNDYIPDLIIMDYYMPELTGLELMLDIIEDKRFADIPFILSTGETNIDVINTSYTAGVYAYIVKPYKRDQLLATVAGALSHTHTQNLRAS